MMNPVFFAIIPKLHMQFNFCMQRGKKIVSEYEQEIPQSQTADKPMAPRRKAKKHSRDTMKTN